MQALKAAQGSTANKEADVKANAEKEAQERAKQLVTLTELLATQTAQLAETQKQIESIGVTVKQLNDDQPVGVKGYRASGDAATILNKEALPEYFETVRDFETEVVDWLSYTQEP